MTTRKSALPQSTVPVPAGAINNFETGARRPPGSRGAAPGRYRGLAGARLPAGGVCRMPASANRDEARAAVPDPWDERGAPIVATVHRRVDVLEQELSHGRISEAAYLTGRILQDTFERTSRIGGASFEGASRRDPREVRIHQMARRVSDAKAILALQERLRGRIGERAARVLRRVLGEGMSFAQAAAFEGKSGTRGVSFIAEFFRVALEDAVAAVQQAKGASPPPPVDAHSAAAREMARREGDSIAGGATLARLEAELATARRTGCLADGTLAGRGAIAVMEMEVAWLKGRQELLR